jgi:hypothetical protein
MERLQERLGFAEISGVAILCEPERGSARSAPARGGPAHPFVVDQANTAQPGAGALIHSIQASGLH